MNPKEKYYNSTIAHLRKRGYIVIYNEKLAELEQRLRNKGLEYTVSTNTVSSTIYYKRREE